MRPLDDATAERLIRLLGMLGSRFDGEIANAGRKASDLLRQHGLQWSDVIAPSLVPPDPPPRSEMPDFDDVDWEDAHGLCFARRHQLGERERSFLESLSEWEGDLTPKQEKWLRDIYARLTRGRR